MAVPSVQCQCLATALSQSAEHGKTCLFTSKNSLLAMLRFIISHCCHLDPARKETTPSGAVKYMASSSNQDVPLRPHRFEEDMDLHRFKGLQFV